jgi:hypothetical protein
MKNRNHTVARQREPHEKQDRLAASKAESSTEFLLDSTDVVALTDYLETRGKQRDLEPERKLMLAVLQDGIDCFRKNLLASDERKSTLFHEAEQWILDGDTSYLFSFGNVCEVFDIDPSYLRKGLLAYKQEQKRELFALPAAS